MKLFEPITIRGLTLKNRIVMPAMGVEVGLRNARARGYYVERAKGGAGAVIFGATMVDSFATDEAWGRIGGAQQFIEGLRPYTKAVREAGARVGIQLLHMNRYPNGLGLRDRRGEWVAPSARIEPDPPRHPGLEHGELMREITAREIESIVASFGKAAAGAREAGFDFVEINLAHGHFPCQFFSPLENRRSDQYGGGLGGRMRFGLECVAAMRGAVGDDYPLFCRLGVEDEGPGGSTIEECVAFALALEQAGIDVMDVSCAQPGRRYLGVICPDSEQPEGTYLHLAAAIKRHVRVPVAAVGRIHNPQFAEAILRDGKADLVALGRQLIADPYWPAKVAARAFHDIAPCQSCNVCCDSSFLSESGRGLRCAVNVVAGKESELALEPAQNKKKVFVIGGGPAGMEAARTAALRGHEVTIFEKGSSLGGMLTYASIAPHKAEMGRLLQWLSRQVEKAGVKVLLGDEADGQSIALGSPDVVVVAAGAEPVVPNIPGVHRANVVGALDVLAGRSSTAGRVAVVGAGMVGIEVAELLAAHGESVTIITRRPDVGKNLGPANREATRLRLWKAGVQLELGAEVVEVVDEGVLLSRNGERTVFPADTVVLATGFRANTALVERLAGTVAELYSIGDCVSPRRLVDAIAEGAMVGRQL